MEMPSTSTLSRNQKYKKVIGIRQKLAMVASECGMPEFRRKYSAIESLLLHWEKSVDVVADSMTLVLSPTKDRSNLVTYYISYVMFHVAIMHVV